MPLGVVVILQHLGKENQVKVFTCSFSFSSKTLNGKTSPCDLKLPLDKLYVNIYLFSIDTFPWSGTGTF